MEDQEAHQESGDGQRVSADKTFIAVIASCFGLWPSSRWPSRPAPSLRRSTSPIRGLELSTPDRFPVHDKLTKSAQGCGAKNTGLGLILWGAPPFWTAYPLK